MQRFHLRRILVVAALITTSCGSFQSNGSKTSSRAAAEPPFVSVTKGDFKLRYRIKGSQFEAFVSCTTSGWVALGLNAPQGMAGSDIIIGYKDQTGAHLRDDYGNSRRSHVADVSLGGQENVANPTATETTGRTEIGFALPVNSNDRYDAGALTAGRALPIILGCGKDGAKNFTGIHKATAAMTITL